MTDLFKVAKGTIEERRCRDETLSVSSKKSRLSFSPSEARRYMTLALEEGKKAYPACLPNPPVGCVLVRRGDVVAKGFSQPPGRPHAEAMALLDLEVGSKLFDIAAFITLEPCSFHGRTPSCAKMLKERQIGAVYVSLIDPHPRNRGRGLRILQEAGIPVEVGVLEKEVALVVSPYLHRGDG